MTSGQPPGHPRPSAPGAGVPDRTKLLEAYQDLVRSERERRNAPPPEPPKRLRHRRAIILSVVAVGLAAVLYVEPAWMFTPPPPAEDPQMQDASLRITMFRAAELVNRYRSDTGDYPTTLTEAGVDTAGLSYQVGPGGQSYLITGRNGPVTLTYSPSLNLDQFLGDSYKLIEARARR